MKLLENVLSKVSVQFVYKIQNEMIHVGNLVEIRSCFATVWGDMSLQALARNDMSMN